MSLTIHTDEDDQRQLLVTVEVDEERVQKAMRSVARELAKEVHVPGFRKGKAPYQVILRRVGEESLRAEAVEKLAQPVFEEMMDELDPDIYSQASLDDIQDKPLVMKYTIPLSPTVQLGDYRELRQEIEEVEVSEEAVAEALERVRERHQVVEEVERPLQAGDVVVLSGLGRLLPLDDQAEDELEDEETAVAVDDDTLDDEEFEDEEFDDDYDDDDYDDEEEDDDYDDDILFDEDHSEMLVDAAMLFPGTPFVDNIVGLSAGEEAGFDFTFPADYEDDELAGRAARFNVRISTVKSRTLPELDDELAQKEGSYETVDALRDSVRQRLQDQAETQAKNDLIEQLIDKLLEDATIVYPPSAADNEVDRMIENLKNRVSGAGWQWEDYLRIQNTSEDEMREEYWETAVERLERQLVLQQFITDEKLRITPEDIDARLEERLEKFDDPELREGMREYMRGEYGIQMLGSEILMDKAYERIRAIFTGEAPDLASLEIDDAAEADEEE